MFEYAHFVLSKPEVDRIVAEHAAEGWRVHSCDPVVMTHVTRDGGKAEALVFNLLLERPRNAYADDERARENAAGMAMTN